MEPQIDAVDMTDFAYVRGEPPQAYAVIRHQPQDFQVFEQCSVNPDGEGEHLWVLVKKTGLTTTRVAECLAETLQIKTREIGYSGLKDRWAVTQQWFSMPWPIRHGDAFPFDTEQTHEVSETGYFSVLQQRRHTRKLRRSTHNANAFVITLRDVVGSKDEIDADLARIAKQGIPNYFGPQRFGHEGRNLALARALFGGKRLRRNQRGFALSAARAFLFNNLLGARVSDGSWNRILPGEAVMLAGTHSVFGADGQDMDALEQRATLFDVHPSGPLAGQQTNQPVSGEALALEQQELERHDGLVGGLIDARVDAARRALRVDTRNLSWHWADANTLTVEMTLPPGSFATSVLREFVGV